MMPTSRAALIELNGITKEFGVVRALSGVDLYVRPGEILGIVGHNGAGKSTLMGVMRGTTGCTAGTVRVDGGDVTPSYSVRRAYDLGIRCVFQEPSLCLTLKVFENTRLIHRDLHGFGWAGRARKLIGASLDAIFPGHGIDVDAVTGDLPTGARQMVEIARAFTVVSAPARLVILDEPTSSLDARIAAQFLAYVRGCPARNQSCILISHRLKEIIGNTGRVVVMRDGAVVGEQPSAGLRDEALVTMMGVMAQARTSAAPVRPAPDPVQAAAAAARPDRVSIDPPRPGAFRLEARAGEVVGLAGLDGHGQRRTLLRVFQAAATSGAAGTVRGRVAYVSGDRHREGVFALWSVAHNVSIVVMRRLAHAGFINPGTEWSLAAQWRDRLGIKTPDVGQPITSLSGGSQQKVLIARALCSGADIVLLDDPMRGVDVSSKREMFEQIRREAAEGKCFLLYTTESEELHYCDRVYVFYQDGITEEIAQSELTEERVLRASFADSAAVDPAANAPLARSA